MPYLSYINLRHPTARFRKVLPFFLLYCPMKALPPVACNSQTLQQGGHDDGTDIGFFQQNLGQIVLDW